MDYDSEFRGEAGVEYRPIPSRPGYYAGDDGSIWSFFRGKPLKRKLATLSTRRFYVTFSTPPLSMQVSRLVLEAFVGPCPEGMECCHGPGGCQDNRPANLRWGTRESNLADSIRFGERGCTRGEENTNAILTEAVVRQIMAMSAEGHGCSAIGRALGLLRNRVWRVTNGFVWNHVTGLPQATSPKRAARRAAYMGES